MAKDIPNDLIIPAQKAFREAKDAFETANNTRSKSKTLLTPKYFEEAIVDARALLNDFFTTDGGVLRPLTVADLQNFAARVRTLKGKYKKGITPKDVIDSSWPADRERANKEIRTSIPVSAKGGELRFITNSGPNSDVSRHHVMVQMLNFPAVAASPADPKKLVGQLIKGPCKIACSCGRWRFWLAYQANVFGYNANENHRESSYPKIRNPTLGGFACKHILRVMQTIIQSGAMRQFLANHIAREQEAVKTKLIRVTKNDMERFNKELTKERAKKGARVSTTYEKQQLREAKQKTPKQKAIDKVVKSRGEKSTKRSVDRILSKKDREAAVKLELMNVERNLRNMPIKLSEEAIKAELRVRRQALMKAIK